MGEATKYIHPPMAVCYRHPGRETNVQCSTCGRSICPDLRAGVAPATYALIAINVIAFIAEVGAGSSLSAFQGGGSIFRDGALNGPAVADGEWYRIVTAGFLHAGI